jgi:hypothetical protein
MVQQGSRVTDRQPGFGIVGSYGTVHTTDPPFLIYDRLVRH